MVAITVAIAATVYVYVSGMIGTQSSTTENAGMTVSGTGGNIRLLLSKAGPKAPYSDVTGRAGFDIAVNGTTTIDRTGWTLSLADAFWDAGESITLTEDNNGNTIHAGCNYAVTCTILGSVIYDSTILVTP
jgi:hypothetical protein